MAQTKPKDELNGNVIADTAIRQPVFITMIMLAAVVLGLLSFRSLPVNLFPDISMPIVGVVLSYPGAGPESVAELVTKPVEDALNTLNGIDTISSTSSEGLAQIVLQFDYDVDGDLAEQRVRERVDNMMAQLPTDVRDPTYFKFDPNSTPVIMASIASDGSMTPLELRDYVEDEIAPVIERIEGVGSVDIDGGNVRQINVEMDLDKLKTYQILPVQISAAIQQANSNLSLGTITAETIDVNLRAPSMIQEPQDIGRIQITGTPYRISDVATIQDGIAEVNTYARLNGQESVLVSIQKQTNANTVNVAEEARNKLAELVEANPKLSYTVTSDQSEMINESIESALHELVLASVAALLVVFIFFRDVRNTLVTIAGLPIIMIATFAALQLFGITINVISLMALSLSVGLVIDDAIVVRENIFRHMERGETPRIASSRGTAEVALSVVAMTTTVIAVFLPVAFTDGITGIIFKSFGITVASAMAISLGEAFLMAPMLSAILFKQQKVTHHFESTGDADRDMALQEANEDPGIFGRFYARILTWSLHSIWTRLCVVAIALAVMGLSVLVASGLSFSFMPSQDEGQFSITFEMPAGTTLSETNAMALRAEQILLEEPSIENFSAKVGGAGAAEQATLSIDLHEGYATADIQAILRQKLNFLPQASYSQPSMTGSSTTGITGRTLQINIRSERPVEEIAGLLLQFQGEASSIEGLVDIDTSYRPGKPELQFHVDPSKVGNLGITNQDIASSVRALISGDRVSTYRNNGEDTDIFLRLKESDRTGVDSIRSIVIPTGGGPVPLSALVTVEQSSSPTSIRRTDRQNEIIIGANLEGRNLVDVQNEIKARMPNMDIPSDITVEFGGESTRLNDSFGSMYIAMALSVLFVYMILASQFGSFTQPIIIMMAMPFSFIGAFVALRLTGRDLDMLGMIGLIMLLGLVTKNSILLIDFTNRLRSIGMDKHTALIRAGAVRLRPILMTTLAIVAGSLPVAIGMGEGSELRSGLSIVLIGGLITSMLLTLLVVPTVYSLFEAGTDRLTAVFRRRKEREEAALRAAAQKEQEKHQAHNHETSSATNGHANGRSNGQEPEQNGAIDVATVNSTSDE
jgi:HAE1 family hydrophobic/amphiphilic exporter-1